MELETGGVHLTYCTNIHPGDGWADVDANIRRFAPALKARCAPSRPFGLGLRLSARDARELLEGDHLESFRRFLDAEGLYVAIINGFPYGRFHGTPVKADVYAPDWRDDARVEYTGNLIRILQRLLPAGMEGGVSTVPLTYKAWVKATDSDAMERMAGNVARVAAMLIRLKQEHGTRIHLDIEPEPDCLIETSAETIDFFDRWLLPVGGAMVSAACGLPLEQARAALLDHVQVCFDCCHFAVEYEQPETALDRLRDAGIRIGRVQLSSAIDVTMPADSTTVGEVAARLQPFADSTYLHQVVERNGAALRQFPDLDQALHESAGASGKQWRIHFHVPLFTSEYDGLGSTQSYVRAVIDRAVRTPFTQHLEIETYTWDVLPGDLKLELGESIHREYQWVLAAAREAAGRA